MAQKFEVEGKLSFDGDEVAFTEVSGQSHRIQVNRPDGLRQFVGFIMSAVGQRITKSADQLLGQRAGDR